MPKKIQYLLRGVGDKALVHCEQDRQLNKLPPFPPLVRTAKILKKKVISKEALGSLIT